MKKKKKKINKEDVMGGRKEIIVETAVTKLRNLKAVGITGFWGNRGQVTTPNL